MPQVDVLVSNELLPELPKGLAVMEARETARAAENEYTTRVTIEMAYVPDGALTVTPIFMTTPDGIRVQSLEWTYAD